MNAYPRFTGADDLDNFHNIDHVALFKSRQKPMRVSDAITDLRQCQKAELRWKKTKMWVYYLISARAFY